MRTHVLYGVCLILRAANAVQAAALAFLRKTAQAVGVGVFYSQHFWYCKLLASAAPVHESHGVRTLSR